MRACHSNRQHRRRRCRHQGNLPALVPRDLLFFSCALVCAAILLPQLSLWRRGTRTLHNMLLPFPTSSLLA